MRNLRSRRGVRVGAAALVLALAASACGAERDDEDAAQAATGDTSEAPAVATSFGDVETPCGDGDASGATEQGVTDRDITIGYGDDRGFAASPGLNQEMGDTMEAMIAWCNEQGGINGRKLVGNRYDAAVMNAASVMQKSCQRDFMLVGHGFAYDEAAEQFRVACDMPSVPAFAIGPNTSMGPNKFEPVPLPIDTYNSSIIAASMEVEPAFRESVGYIDSSSAAVTLGLARAKTGIAAQGADLAECGVTLAQEGEANYVPFAQKLKNCDVKTIWNTNTPGPITFGLFEAMQRVKANKQYVMEATWYAEPVRQWNAESKAIDGTLIGLMFQPLENADLVPAVQDYIDLIEKAGTTPSLLGMQAVSAFLLWATAANECGADLTRDCVTEKLSQVTEWTGGGLHAQTNPAENKPTACALVVRLEGGEYTQVFPEERGEFYCDDKNLVDVDPATAGVTLDKDRISTTFAKQ